MMSDVDFICIDGDGDDPVCAECELSFRQGDRAIPVYIGDREFGWCHFVCPQRQEQLEALLHDDGKNDPEYLAAMKAIEEDG